jgi:hypothetical protein
LGGPEEHKTVMTVKDILDKANLLAMLERLTNGGTNKKRAGEMRWWMSRPGRHPIEILLVLAQT